MGVEAWTEKGLKRLRVVTVGKNKMQSMDPLNRRGQDILQLTMLTLT